jgi:hypothetical protein
MQTYRSHFVTVLVACSLMGWLDISAARAQLFGDRNLGSGLRRGTTPGPTAEGGMELRSVDPERFVRGQRRADAFVGAQTNAAADFVGREIPGGGAAIRSAIDGTLPRQNSRRASRINRPLPPTRRNTISPPRFALAPDIQPGPPLPAEDSQFPSLEMQLEDLMVRRIGPDVTVHIANRQAVLEGSVGTKHQRRLAEIMLGFEPGIDTVVNRLVVDPSR